MPNYSIGMQASLQTVTRDDQDVVLLEITHPDLAAPVRVCSDTQDLTSGGQTFTATSFLFTPPDDRDRQSPRARLSFSNVGRDLMSWLEQAGGGAGAQCRIRLVRRSLPDNVELDITLGLYNIQADVSVVTADLGFDSLMDRPAMGLRFDPRTAPGLF